MLIPWKHVWQVAKSHHSGVLLPACLSWCFVMPAQPETLSAGSLRQIAEVKDWGEQLGVGLKK